MGIISNLLTLVKDLADKTDISQVVYDDITGINADNKNNYPLLLFRVVSSSSEDYRSKKENPTYDVDFYLTWNHPPCIFRQLPKHIICKSRVPKTKTNKRFKMISKMFAVTVASFFFF